MPTATLTNNQTNEADNARKAREDAIFEAASMEIARQSKAEEEDRVRREKEGAGSQGSSEQAVLSGTMPNESGLPVTDEIYVALQKRAVDSAERFFKGLGGIRLSPLPPLPPLPPLSLPVITIPKIDGTRLLEMTNVREKMGNLLAKSKGFYAKLRELSTKGALNSEEGIKLQAANNAVVTIYKNINQLYIDYISKEIDLPEFKSKSESYLDSDNEHVKTLNQHRGIKQILVNLLAFIVGLGVFYGIAALATGRLMLFNPATDSRNRINELNEAIEDSPAEIQWEL